MVSSAISQKFLGLTHLAFESEPLSELEVKVFSTSSQQSSMAATHSSKSGGHCVTGSVLGPEVKMDSRALRLTLDRRDMVNGRHLS